MANGNGFIKTITEKDEQGKVISTREVGAYAGVLNRAHQEGLRSIRTTLVQVPSADNKMTAITYAEVVTTKGTFKDYGDANPDNVEAKYAGHIIRVAMTRAKARALADAINVGAIPLTELGQGDPNGNGNGKRPKKQSNGSGQSGAHVAMTVFQHNHLRKLLEKRGQTVDAADTWLKRAFNVTELGNATKKQASSMIRQLEQGKDLSESAVN